MRHLRSTSFEKIVFDWKPLIIFKGGSRAAATSRMECFVIIVNGWNTKHFILDFAAALDPPLIFAIFVWVSGFSSQPSLMGSDYASDPYSGTLEQRPWHFYENNLLGKYLFKVKHKYRRTISKKTFQHLVDSISIIDW